MQFRDFYKHLKEKNPTPRVEIELLRTIVDTFHCGVGQLEFRYFDDFDGAQWGSFIWLEEERTSAYEEPHNDATVFINAQFSQDRPMRRIIAAKEMMHVFDAPAERATDPEIFKKLLNEIASKPLLSDTSAPYAADRVALWKALISLVPDWLRSEYLDPWKAGEIKAHELAARWWLPENAVAAAMGDYYNDAFERFELS